MSERNAAVMNCSVSASARSASMSLSAVRFYSYCDFYYYGWRRAAAQGT